MSDRDASYLVCVITGSLVSPNDPPLFVGKAERYDRKATLFMVLRTVKPILNYSS